MSDGTIFPSPTGGLPLSDGGPHLDPIYSEIDPGPVGAGRRWVILSTGAYSIRNDANTGWNAVGGTGTVPAFALVGAIAAEAIGSTASAGVATSVPRGDHRHAMPASGAPVAEALGSTQVTGAAGTFADSAHRHAMPAKSVAVPLVASGSGSAGTSANPALDDHVHPAQAAGGAIDYGEVTSPVSVTATTEDTANTIASGAGATYAAVPIMVEWCIPYVTTAQKIFVVLLYDGASSIGILAANNWTANGQQAVMSGRARITPSAAAHTYSLRAYTDGGGASAGAGAGGHGNIFPAYIRTSLA